MRELVRSTFAALDEAALSYSVLELRDRVFAREVDDLLETRNDGNGHRWSFKPMVELLLCHVRDLARSPHVPDDERHLEIMAAIELAGF